MQEAKGFRDEIKAFNAHPATVIGISRDSIASHKKFRSKLDLPFILLSDPEGKVCEQYGVIKEKKLFGKTIKGIVRSTFIIDAKGIIRAQFRNVKVKGHVRDVLDALEQL